MKRLLWLGLCFLLIGCHSKSLQEDLTDVYQLAPPIAGDRILVIQTELGDIKIKLFDDEAPYTIEALEMFVSRQGYEGIYFDRVEADLVIQLGFTTTYFDYEDVINKPYIYETAPNIKNIKGAVALLHQVETKHVAKSMYIVTGEDLSKDEIEQIRDLGEAYYSEDIVRAYDALGGAIRFDGLYTIIGQVYEGLDIVDKINTLETEILFFGKEYSMLIDPIPIEGVFIEILQ